MSTNMSANLQYKKEDEKNESSGYLELIWSSSTGEFLGRTGSSWFKIILFYTIFYAILTAFWGAILFAFHQTLDKHVPKFTLSSNPGLGFTPRREKSESTLIWLKNGTNDENLKYWSDSLTNFLEPYEKLDTNNSHIEKCDNNKFAEQDKFCLFDVKKISHQCSRSQAFGYQHGDPCVLIKLNRIFNWVPEPYTEEDLKDEKIPAMVKDAYLKTNQSILITCEGENSADKQNIGPISFYPQQGIESKFFPFTNQPGYLSPFVFAHFEKPTAGVSISVLCRAWAKNLDRDASVHFELRIDSQ